MIQSIPRQYWWAIQDPNNEECLSVEAAVLVRVEGIASEVSDNAITEKKINDSRIKEPEISSLATLKQILLPQHAF